MTTATETRPRDSIFVKYTMTFTTRICTKYKTNILPLWKVFDADYILTHQYIRYTLNYNL